MKKLVAVVFLISMLLSTNGFANNSADIGVSIKAIGMPGYASAGIVVRTPIILDAPNKRLRISFGMGASILGAALIFDIASVPAPDRKFDWQYGLAFSLLPGDLEHSIIGFYFGPEWVITPKLSYGIQLGLGGCIGAGSLPIPYANFVNLDFYF